MGAKRMPDWSDYQERVAEFFRGIGMSAETNVTIQGVRTSHDIDVLVRSSHAGFEVVWLVECKYWSTRVSKLHVLGLREIVSDTGADRGLLLSESGFQCGAMEAANMTNVRATSLAQCQADSASQIAMMRLNELFDRSAILRAAYWEIPKRTRIEYGLRGDLFDGYSYNGESALDVIDEIIFKSNRGVFPFNLDCLGALGMSLGDVVLSDIGAAVELADRLVVQLEELLRAVPNAGRHGNGLLV